MSARPLAMVILAFLISAACNGFSQDDAVTVSAQDATLNTRWHANIASPASLAGAVQMRGSASMAPSPDGNGTNVTLALANASPGGLHPWAVHRGQCGVGMGDGLFGRNELYQPLKIGSDGIANGTATVPMRTSANGSYYVVVHASVANPGTVVACGNLAAPTR